MNKQVWVSVKYDNYYKLINKIHALIKIYEIKKRSDYLLIKMDYSDYEMLCKYIVSYEFVIVGNVGIYYYINAILKNKLFVVTSLLGLIVFFILNSVIVDIEVLHEDEYIVSLLEEELKSLGIDVLTFKKDYDEITEIKQSILSKYDDKIDWLEIEVVGMKYVIRVEERILNNVEDDNIDYCNIYASSSGIIKSIVVETGVSVVSIGDYVNEGDLLISGDIIYNEEVVNEVCASGEVTAEKWYQTNVSVPFSYYEEVPTGVVRYNLVYEYEKTSAQILKNRIEDYISSYTLLFDLFGRSVYLEKQIEVTRVYKNYSEEEALEKAFLLNEENIILKIGENNLIIDQKVLKNSTNDSTIEVEIFTITQEVIS